MRKMKKTITVYSTRGGSGKTMTATTIAKVLATRGYKTVIIDGDIEAPSLSYFFRLGEKLHEMESWTSYLNQPDMQISEIVQETEIANLSVIYTIDPEMGKKNLQKTGRSWWEGALRKSILAQTELYKLGFDFIVVDNQSGISLNSVNNMIYADISVLVIRPVNYGVDATQSFVHEIYKILKGVKERKDYYIWTQVLKTETAKEKELLNTFLTHYNERLMQAGLLYGTSVHFDRLLNLLLLNKDANIIKQLPAAITNSISILVEKFLKVD